jgi:sterol desaturase/sphingolipid hydroxylase (fatty acid hydroxylase superfamily)
MTYFFAAIFGMITWTLAEYLLHRFLGHELVKLKKYSKFYREHAKHHFIFNYFVSGKDKAMAFLKVGPVLFLISAAVSDPQHAVVFTLSFLGGYLVYELIHRRLHLVAPPNRFAAYMRAHHLYHHFVDENMNHGVLTDFWDRVFGTKVEVQSVEIPAKFKLNWLKELNCGESTDDGYGHTYSIH